MKSEDQILRLVERFNKNKACSLFNQFHEKFVSKNSSQIIITTKEQFECVSTLNDCLDKHFFEKDDLFCHFNKFWQNEKIQSTTYVEFEFYNKQEHVNTLLQHLLAKSEEVKKQKDVVIIKLPTTVNLFFKFITNFNRTFISNNRKNESFLIFTNNVSLIELYETL